jgi:hypothetical protein
MARLDYYDIRPAGLDAYLSHYGYHFSPAMAHWAVEHMEPRGGGRMRMMDKEAVEKLLRDREVDFRAARGHDLVYIANMIVADRWGSSVKNEDQLALAIKDELDDPDGYDGMAFSRFLADCNAKGVPIVWEDMI